MTSCSRSSSRQCSMRSRPEARFGRAAQPTAPRHAGDPPQRDLRRSAQGAAGRDSGEHPRRVHPIAEGGLCGRPSRAAAGVAADGPRSRAGAATRAQRPPRTATRAAAAVRQAMADRGRASGAIASSQPKGSRFPVDPSGGFDYPRLVVFDTISMARAHGCTLADEVSSAGVFCILTAPYRREK